MMDSAVVLEEHPWMASEMAEPCVTLSAKISARERKKLLAIA